MYMSFVKRLTDIMHLHVLDVCVQINYYQYMYVMYVTIYELPIK